MVQYPGDTARHGRIRIHPQEELGEERLLEILPDIVKVLPPVRRNERKQKRDSAVAGVRSHHSW